MPTPPTSPYTFTPDVMEHTAAEAAIRHVLLTVWDPLGVQGYSPEHRDAVQDEYDDYIDGVRMLLMRGATEGEIASYLHDAECQQMRRIGRESRAREAARALTSLRDR